MNRYILNEAGEPVPEPDRDMWQLWFLIVNREADNTIVDGHEVSTVFLGLDHGFYSEADPVLWETMVFGGVHDQYQERCGGTREDALVMHKRVVTMVSSPT